MRDRSTIELHRGVAERLSAVTEGRRSAAGPGGGHGQTVTVRVSGSVPGPGPPGRRAAGPATEAGSRAFSATRTSEPTAATRVVRDGAGPDSACQ